MALAPSYAFFPLAPFTKGHFKGVHTPFQSRLALRQSSRSSHLASAKDGVENGARCAALPRDKNPVLRLSDPVTVLMKSEDWGDAGLAAPPSCNQGIPGTILAHGMAPPNVFPGVRGQAANSENGRYFYYAGRGTHRAI